MDIGIGRMGYTFSVVSGDSGVKDSKGCQAAGKGTRVISMM